MRLVLLLAATLFQVAFSDSGFKYLGSFTDPKARSFNQHDYYVSLAKAPWYQARQACHNLFGSQVEGKLVELQSVAEWEGLRNLLSNIDLLYGEQFWTGGVYDGQSWRWPESDYVFADWAPWEQPPVSNWVQRSVITFYRFNQILWGTDSETSSKKYICELKSNRTAAPCVQQTDLAIVIDSSGSISEEDYDEASYFAANIAIAFTQYPTSRIGVVIYASFAYLRISINNDYDASTIESIIRNRFTYGGTDTASAIETATDNLLSNKQAWPQKMVVITDGYSTNYTETKMAADNATMAGITMYSVGVGLGHNTQELLDIAGGRVEHMFTTEGFEELITLLRPVSLELCENE